MAGHNNQSSQSGLVLPNDGGNWAPPVSRLKVGKLPRAAVNLNVEGRRILSPLSGFGQLWEKTYRIRLAGAAVTPQEVIAEWKRDYPSFWPKGNRFYSSLPTITPGDVAVLDLKLAGPVRLSTGVLVIYADDNGFCFMTPQGHMYGGMISFSAEEQDGATVAEVQALLRASDPFFELVNRVGIGNRIEDRFWHKTLANLGAHFGVQACVEQENKLIDAGVQWSQAKNIWHNSAIRTTFYILATPLRRLRDRIRSA